MWRPMYGWLGLLLATVLVAYTWFLYSQEETKLPGSAKSALARTESPPLHAPGPTAQPDAERSPVAAPNTARSTALRQTASPQQTASPPPTSPPPRATGSAAESIAPAELINQFFADLAERAANRPNPDVPPVAPALALHEAFLTQKPDPNWSSNVESELQGNFAPRLDPRQVQLVNMECRTTICEMTAVGTQASAVQVWQDTVFQMPKGEWFSTESLEHAATHVSTAPDGRFILITYLTRTSKPK